MTTAVKAIYENGVFKPVAPVDLEEHSEVEVLIPVHAMPQDEDDPTGWKAARKVIGLITEELVDEEVDLNHDLHIYHRDS